MYTWCWWDIRFFSTDRGKKCQWMIHSQNWIQITSMGSKRSSSVSTKRNFSPKEIQEGFKPGLSLIWPRYQCVLIHSSITIIITWTIQWKRSSSMWNLRRSLFMIKLWITLIKSIYIWATSQSSVKDIEESANRARSTWKTFLTRRYSWIHVNLIRNAIPLSKLP